MIQGSIGLQSGHGYASGTPLRRVRAWQPVGLADDRSRSGAGLRRAGAGRARLVLGPRAAVLAGALSRPRRAHARAGHPAHWPKPGRIRQDLPLRRVRRQRVRAHRQPRARARVPVHGAGRAIPAAVFPAWRHPPQQPLRAGRRPLRADGQGLVAV